MLHLVTAVIIFLLGALVAWQTRAWRLLVLWAAFDVLALFLGGTKFTREYFLQLCRLRCSLPR